MYKNKFINNMISKKIGIVSENNPFTTVVDLGRCFAFPYKLKVPFTSEEPFQSNGNLQMYQKNMNLNLVFC